jgi:hypothetical protein
VKPPPESGQHKRASLDVKALSAFGQRVLIEPARLALSDPEGEADAVVEEAVTGVVDLASSVLLEQPPERLVVPVPDIAPALVADRLENAGGPTATRRGRVTGRGDPRPRRQPRETRNGSRDWVIRARAP